jgi:hypothetical protein
MKPAAAALALVLSTPWVRAQEFEITRATIDHAEDVDFGAFESYAWKASQDPGENDAPHAALVFHIDRTLQAAGLRRAETAAEAQLLVRYYTSVERRVRSTTTQERVIAPDNQRTSVGFRQTVEGTLVIELYRASDDRRVWRGSTSDTTGRERLSDEQVRHAVELILSEYPPDPERAESGPDR